METLASYLEPLVSLTVVMGFIGTIFSYAVIRPLNETIKSLQAVVQELKDQMDQERDRHSALAERVVSIETDVKNIHYQLDKIERK